MTTKSALIKETEKLQGKLNQVTLPPDLKTKAQEMITRLNLMAEHSGYSIEYERTSQYINWIVKIMINKLRVLFRI